jgi:hypothetical protein
MARFNGHRSWNAWNVSLWIGNDESLYRSAIECWNAAEFCKRTGERRTKVVRLRAATNRFLAIVGQGSKTPEGGVYNRTCVREAIANLLD